MRRLLVSTLVLCAAIPSVAIARTKHGITPTSPKAGAVLPAGQGLKFKGRVRGKGAVFVRVSRKRARSDDGVISRGVSIMSAKRRGGRFTATAKRYSFPSYYLNKAGIYYWQAYRIDCVRTTADCLAEGPVQRFRVR